MKKDPRTEDKTEYNVWCQSCGNVWSPLLQSPLWWAAKQRADKGFIDAYCATPEQCGCTRDKEQGRPDAPFRIMGYDDMLHDFDIPFDTFTGVVREALKLERALGYTFFVVGVSNEVMEEIRMAAFKNAA